MTGGQFWPLAKRSVIRTLRQPPLILPSFLFPLFMLAVVGSGGSDVTEVEGFPTDSYITFILGATMVQGASGAATMAGTNLGKDIGTGFLNRLALTPMQTSTLILANLAGVAVLGAAQAAIYLGVGLLAGASIEAGVAGALAIVGVAVLLVLAFAALGSLAAVVARSGEQIQGLVSVVLALLFMSSMLIPRNLIESDWFKTIATYNPLSYFVEAPRSLFVDGWDAEALALGCGLALLCVFGCLAIAVSRLRRSVV